MYKNLKQITDNEFESLFEDFLKKTFEEIRGAEDLKCSLEQKKVYDKRISHKNFHTTKLTFNIVYRDFAFEDLQKLKTQ